jgi:NAD(P)-dependent dehydrogenase (short-subunit alcohol dehydrogenase family)
MIAREKAGSGTMETLKGKTAVVTGGGAGIGRGLCLGFAGEGMNVVVVDREADRAHAVAAEVEAAGAKALAQACDVSDAAAVEALKDAVVARFGSADVLCNNAGVVQFGPAAEAPQEDWEWVFRVNVWGVVNGVRSFTPQMRAQGGGHIVNTASLSGIFAVPGLGVYTASKYAVMGLSETLRLELAADNIGVSVLCPGPVRSRIGETARRRDGIERMGVIDGLPRLGWREPADAARVVIAGIKANRPYIYTHAKGAAGTEMRFKAMLEDFATAP